MMTQITDLRVSGTGRPGYYRTTDPWTVRSDRYSMTITIPGGFVFDGDSVPRLPIIYMLAKGRAGLRAPCLHDWLYAHAWRGTTRRMADAMYWDAMRAWGVGWWWAVVHYVGVRLGGWVAWRRYRRGGS